MIHHDQYDSLCSIGWRLKNEDRIADSIIFYIIFWKNYKRVSNLIDSMRLDRVDWNVK